MQISGEVQFVLVLHGAQVSVCTGGGVVSSGSDAGVFDCDSILIIFGGSPVVSMVELFFGGSGYFIVHSAIVSRMDSRTRRVYRVFVH